MEEKQVTGNLADGQRYRATRSVIEVVDANGTVAETIDLSDINTIQRTGSQLILRPYRGSARILECSSSGDAGRLEHTLRPAAMPAEPVRAVDLHRILIWGAVAVLIFIVIVVIFIVATSS